MFIFVKFLFGVCIVKLVIAKPVNDAILFRDDDESQSYLNLNDENQILPSKDKTRLLPDTNEIVQKELENGEFFQGDIVLLPDQKEYLSTNLSDSTVPVRTGWLDEYYRWPKNDQGYVLLPYIISKKSGFSEIINKFHDRFALKLVLSFSKLPENSSALCNERS